MMKVLFFLVFGLMLAGFGVEHYQRAVHSYETTIKVKGYPDRVINRFCSPKLVCGAVHIDCGATADFVYPAQDVQLIHRKKPL